MFQYWIVFSSPIIGLTLLIMTIIVLILMINISLKLKKKSHEHQEDEKSSKPTIFESNQVYATTTFAEQNVEENTYCEI